MTSVTSLMLKNRFMYPRFGGTSLGYYMYMNITLNGYVDDIACIRDMAKWYALVSRWQCAHASTHCKNLKAITFILKPKFHDPERFLHTHVPR